MDEDQNDPTQVRHAELDDQPEEAPEPDHFEGNVAANIAGDRFEDKAEEVPTPEPFEFDPNAPLWHDVQRGVAAGLGTPLTFAIGCISREVKASIKSFKTVAELDEIEPGLAQFGSIEDTFDIHDQILVFAGLNILGCYLPPGQTRDRLDALLKRLVEKNDAALDALTEEQDERGRNANEQLELRRIADMIGVSVEELKAQSEASEVQAVDDEITPEGEDGPTLH